MKEITLNDSFIGGSSSVEKPKAKLEWAGGAKTKRKASKPKPKPKRKASKAKPKPKPKRKASTKRKSSRKGGANPPKQRIVSNGRVIYYNEQGQQLPNIPNGDASTADKIESAIDVISLSPPSLYAKYKLAKQLGRNIARDNRVAATEQDIQNLQDMVNARSTQAAQSAEENIYNVRRNPYDINADPYNVDNKALDTGRNFGEVEDTAEAAAEGDADAAEVGADALDAGEVLEGLADFFGLAFGAGKKKRRTKSKGKPKKKTQAQWTRKRNSVIKKVKEHKKKMKKRGGSFWSDIGDFFENLPTDIADGFVTIKDAITGDNSFGPKLDPNKLPVWNTFGLSQDQIANDELHNGILNVERKISVPKYQRHVPGVIGSGESKVGGKETKEKTPDELALAEANKRMRDAKRRFDNAVKEYYTDFKQKLIDENNVDKTNKEVMKDLSKYVAWHKKAGMDKLKTRLAWAHANAYADELNALLNSRPQYIPNKTGLGKKKKTVTKRKTTTKKKSTTKKKVAPKPKKSVIKRKSTKKK